MIVFTIYYIGLIAGESFANRLLIPPFLAMWGTDILFSLVGLYWSWQLQRQGVRARSLRPGRGR
jgi:lipopolysaccharide export LptBFGC system permease protein LptF